jgi:hypothetical protein
MSDFSGIGPNGVPQFVGMADEFVSFEDLPETTRTYVAAMLEHLRSLHAENQLTLEAVIRFIAAAVDEMEQTSRTRGSRHERASSADVRARGRGAAVMSRLCFMSALPHPGPPRSGCDRGFARTLAARAPIRAPVRAARAARRRPPRRPSPRSTSTGRPRPPARRLAVARPAGRAPAGGRGPAARWPACRGRRRRAPRG